MNTRAKIHANKGQQHWLESAQLLDFALLDQARASADRQKQALVKYLVDQDLVDSTRIAEAASLQFSLPLLDLEALDRSLMPLSLVELSLIKKHHVLPLRKNHSVLYLGLSDSGNTLALEEIKFHTDCRVEPVIIEEHKLNAAIQELTDKQFNATRDGEPGQLDFNSPEIEFSDEDPDEDPAADIDETPVMRFVNKLLLDAIRLGVSDIHIETFEKFSRIRFREDGLLREITRPPLNVTRKIGSRFKVMAKLDIAEKRLPQDGRFRLNLSRSRAIDFRVSTMPTLWGEKTVLRILDFKMQKLDLDAMGYAEEQKSHYLDALKLQQGLILVTGPTGSGKSLSLYAGLKILNTQERNIATAEEPVEIHIQGINQVAVNHGIGLDFAEALRAFMRQDPDVLMVGEIRDVEKAEMALRAAQTGHLVMSTLHTNNAPETFARLMEMGIPAYQIATSLSLIIAQRLARRLCNHCKKPVKLPRKVLQQEGFPAACLDKANLYAPVGCELCQSGYKGRIGIYEVLPITDDISRVIMGGGNSIQVAELARKSGLNSLRLSALEKVAQGITSLAEINRIAGSGNQA